jgi:hypothetical protein
VKNFDLLKVLECDEDLVNDFGNVFVFKKLIFFAEPL